MKGEGWGGERGNGRPRGIGSHPMFKILKKYHADGQTENIMPLQHPSVVDA